MTLATLLQPGWFAVLFGWSFLILSAAQLTVRLIMAFSVRSTLLAALVLSVLALIAAAMYDLLIGPAPSVAGRLVWVPVSMLLMAAAGFITCRWVLHIKRLRGQVAAAVMIGLLDPHLFTLLAH